MRSSSSSRTPPPHQSTSLICSFLPPFVDGNKKPTSALSKIGKHAPPPISPIISLKSTNSSVSDFSYENKGSSKLSSLSAATSKSSSLATTTSSSSATTTCAWRIPKSADLTPPPPPPPPETVQVTKYPQRKVPALTPEPPVKEETMEKKKEAPKSFFERHEEFPGLQGKKPVAAAVSSVSSSAVSSASSITGSITGTITGSITGTINGSITGSSTSSSSAAHSSSAEAGRLAPIPQISVPMPPLPTKLVGGDFNFLEDDDWLDGDSIDYSQNLFQDNDHFLPSLPHQPATEPHVVVKAKSLLAERSHSSKKKDIWKPVPEEPKAKIKILKRPEVEIAEQPNLVKKFTTAEVKKGVAEEVKKGVAEEKRGGSKVPGDAQKAPEPKAVLKFETKADLKAELKHEVHPELKAEAKQEEVKTNKKIFYSSASKTLKKSE